MQTGIHDNTATQQRELWVKAAADCSKLPFEQMPVHRRVPDDQRAK